LSRGQYVATAVLLSLSLSLSLSLVFCYCSQSATNIVYFIRPTMKRERDWGKKKKKE
jgi:hypothetical protein